MPPVLSTPVPATQGKKLDFKSILANVLCQLSAKRGWVVAILALFYLARKIKELSRSKHGLLYERPSFDVDNTIWPHYFANKDGLWIYWRGWTVPRPKGLVFICHGYGEHIGRYQHVAEFLNSHGYSVYGLDHQGHGLSYGDRAYVERFNDFVTDYLQFVEMIQSNMQPVPSFLIAHSMGGTIGSLVMAASPSTNVWPWRGCILSAPAIYPDPTLATPALLAAGRFFSNYLPKLKLKALNAEAVSRIKSVVHNYKHDSLVINGPMRARTGWEILKGMTEVKRLAPTFGFSFLIIQGTADTLTIAEGAEYVYEHANSSDKQLKLYEGGYHELFNDINRHQVLEDILEWIEARVGVSSPSS